MADPQSQEMEEGIAISRQLAKQQTQSAVAMVLSAVLAFVLTGFIAPGFSGLALAVAAATGLTVSVACQPDTYRRHGSLKLAFVLIAGMWSVPVIVLLVASST